MGLIKAVSKTTGNPGLVSREMLEGDSDWEAIEPFGEDDEESAVSAPPPVTFSDIADEAADSLVSIGIYTIERLASATVSELIEADGVSEQRARELISDAGGDPDKGTDGDQE